MPSTLEHPRTAALWLGYGACALAGCFWGTGFYFGKIVLSVMGVGHMVLYRFAFACIGLLPFALRHRPRLDGREWRLLLIASFFGIPVQYLVQFYGLSLTTVSHASLMVGSMPVMLGVAATLFTGERLDRIGWVALISSTLGVALIVLSRHSSAGGKGPSLVGDLLVLAALLVSLFYGVYSGAIMMAAWVFWQDGLPPVHGVPVSAWLASAASGLFCTAGSTLLWNWGIHHVPASRAAVFLNIEPMLGSFLGVELLGDRLGPSAWVGGVLIIAAAITLTSRPLGLDTTGIME
jgi:drug/metabolite transporter (DMT)-like permease